MCVTNPYPLPMIDFVGGETQDLVFHTYFRNNKNPFGLSGCTANFAIVSFTNKIGVPIISKKMSVSLNTSNMLDNILKVTLLPEETVGLFGKYIYQISIKDVSGDIEIPKQGIMLITNNIDKGFIR